MGVSVRQLCQGWLRTVSETGGYYVCTFCGVEITFANVEALGRRDHQGVEGLDIVYTCHCPESQDELGVQEAVHAYYRLTARAYRRLCGGTGGSRWLFNPVLPYRASPGEALPLTDGNAVRHLEAFRAAMAGVVTGDDFVKACERGD